MRSAAETLVGEFATAARVLNDWWQEGAQDMLVFPESRRVETAFKSVHMWLRAYQDAVCGVLLATRGDAVRRHTSMSDRIKPGKPIGQYLDQNLPEYAPWFTEWRDRRNEMKIGALFNLEVEGVPPAPQRAELQVPARPLCDDGDGRLHQPGRRDRRTRHEPAPDRGRTR